jgi:GTP-binding protein
MESNNENQWPRTLFQLNLKPIQSQNNFFNFFSDKILSYSKKKKILKNSEIFYYFLYKKRNQNGFGLISTNMNLFSNSAFEKNSNSARRLPIVTIVGKSNVGKSTLVNRIAGTFDNGSIVHDMIGVTRDRTYKKASWLNYEYLVTDTGGILLGNKTKDNFSDHILEQSLIAIQEASLIIFVVDGKSGLTIEDIELAEYLKSQKCPIILVVNKCDNSKSLFLDNPIYWSLGLGEPIPISAIHGINSGELMQKITSYLPKVNFPFIDDTVDVAIIGRPNAGKSSILNILTGKTRSIVSEIPGTTRDSVDSFVSGGVNCNLYNLIDTAGIRRKKSIDYGTEFFMINRSFKAINKAKCILFIIDVTTGITEQDQKLSERINDQGKACVIVMNKWDQIFSRENFDQNELILLIKNSLPALSWAEILFVSALEGTRCNKILEAVDSAITQYNRHIPTSVLNEIIQDAIRWRPPPTNGSGKQGKIYYCTQISENPPSISIFVNDPDLFNESYRKYITSQLRNGLGFKGTSIRLFWIKRK